MPASIEMTNRQKVSAGVTILDEDSQPFATLPPGITVTFVSSEPTVADFVMGSDGMNGEVTSGAVGSSIITATVVGLPAGTLSDTLAVAVINSAPGSVTLTVGTPVDE
jgi:uncharacterized protein YjdB